MRAGCGREFPAILENHQKCLSFNSEGISSFGRFSHGRKGRKEAYFCLDFLLLFHQGKSKKKDTIVWE